LAQGLAERAQTGDVRVTVAGAKVFAQQVAAPDGALDRRRGDWDAPPEKHRMVMNHGWWWLTEGSDAAASAGGGYRVVP
jgi:hypothetical protein